MDHRDLAVAGAKDVEIDNPGVLFHAPHSRGWDFGSQPSVFAVAPLKVLLRSLPPFLVYSLAGAVGGGKGGGEDVSGDCGNAGALRAGVGGLPGVLSTKVRVLLRPGVVEGHPGELGTTSVVSSCVCFQALISAWSASFSAASRLLPTLQRLCHGL
jgi:hypothetical protein